MTRPASWQEIELAEPDSPGARGWAHSGIVVVGDDVVTVDPLRPELVRLDRSGRRVWSCPVDVVDGHGLALAGDGVWIADCGQKNVEVSPGRYRTRDRTAPTHGTVVRVGFDGTELARLPTPRASVYADHTYRPTAVAVDDAAAGGTGDVWVADGYGQSLLHRYDRHGSHVQTVGRAGGEGPLDTPHGLHVDRRGSEPLLYVADRENHRVAVFDLDGTHVRCFGAAHLRRPSALTTHDGALYVADLTGRVTVFDKDDGFTRHLGASPDADTRPGWPNALDGAGRTVRPPLTEGAFNSPHAVDVTAAGELAVCEWLVGGRVVVCTPP